VISLNLPRIALEAKGNEAAFWTLLDERLLARKALMTRIARLEGVKPAWRQSSIWKVRRASESGR
jgi:ribonucleoside-triphosphate reductase